MDEIYKYQTIDNFTLDALRNNYLYFAKPSQFNDPFDCHINSTWEGTKQEIIDFFTLIGDKNLAEMVQESPEEYYNFNSDLLSESQIESTTDGNQVLCLSKDPTNLILWGNYADKHKGICLAFNTKKYEDKFFLEFNATELNYSSQKILGKDFIPELYPKGYLPLLCVTYQKEMPEKVNLVKELLLGVERPVQSCHPFRFNVAGHTGLKLPPIPA